MSQDARWITGDGGIATTFEGPFTLGRVELGALGLAGLMVLMGAVRAIAGGSLDVLVGAVVLLALVAWMLEHTAWTWLVVRRDRVQVRSFRAIGGATDRALARRVQPVLHGDRVDVDLPLADVTAVDPTFSGVCFTLTDGRRVIVHVPHARRADVLAAVLGVWARSTASDDDAGARAALHALTAEVDR